MESQRQGPFRITKVTFNSLEVMASPSLGGLIKVSISDCKKWSPQLYDDLPLTGDLFEEDFEMSENMPSFSNEMECDEDENETSHGE